MKDPNTAGETVAKCVVWDLDNTLWDGVLLEGDELTLRPHVAEVIRVLDERGILQSIASRNDPALAMAKLKEFGLQEYFLYPQIGWGAKASSIESITGALNLSPDSAVFIDDDPFEQAAVQHALPGVRCLDASDLESIPALPLMKPPHVTKDARRRRLAYVEDAARQDAEENFEGPSETFLATLDMELSIFPAGPDDLDRAEELVMRTHQLNSTGYTYSREELDAFRASGRHLVLMADLEDRFGSYGRIGLAVVEQDAQVWTLKLLLMSCRVMSRGVGTILLAHVMEEARKTGVSLRAEFLPTDRNRMMNIAFRFAGFRETDSAGDTHVLAHDLGHVPPFPDYVCVHAPGPD